MTGAERVKVAGMIAEAVSNSNTLAEVRDALFDVFGQLRQAGHERIGYVSGKITSDGPENILKNIENLARSTDRIRATQDFPVFSATDVFDDEIFKRLDANGFKNSDWEVFWRQVLGADERFVTDMFMTFGWETSRGARDEHTTALQTGMRIEYLKKYSTDYSV